MSNAKDESRTCQKLETQVWRAIEEKNARTLMLMRQSRVPEIVKLAEFHRRDTNEYPTENVKSAAPIHRFDDNIHNPGLSSTLDDTRNTVDNFEDTKNRSPNPEICVTPPSDGTNEDGKNFEGFIVGANDAKTTNNEARSLISRSLNDNREQTYPSTAGRRWLVEQSEISDMQNFSVDDDTFDNILDDFFEFSDSSVILNSTFIDDRKVNKYKVNRPPNLNLSKNDSGCSEYSSFDDKSNSALSSSKTPTECNYETPPAGMVLDLEQQKMAVTLQRFGLTRFVVTFLEQEVDFELFLTLNDQDLQEIGFPSKSDRNVLLSVIAECNRYNPE